METRYLLNKMLTHILQHTDFIKDKIMGSKTFFKLIVSVGTLTETKIKLVKSETYLVK